MNPKATAFCAQNHVRAAFDQGLTGCHFGDHETGTEAGDQATHGGIGDPGHGRQHDPVRQRDAADFYGERP
jgi:hypothetical protein